MQAQNIRLSGPKKATMDFWPKGHYLAGWVQDSCQGLKLIPGHPLE